MALKDFIYGCPFCGHQPLEGEGVRARCPACKRAYEPGRGGGRIQVSVAGEAREWPAEELARRLRELGGPFAGGGREPIDGVFLESEVVGRFSVREEPLRSRGVLLGYIEDLGPRRAGTLRLTERSVQFVEKRGELHEWLVRDLRAIQTSSSSIQISPLQGGVVAFRFESESSRVWEDLLKERLRSVWLEEGRGEIQEFQPRIRSA